MFVGYDNEKLQYEGRIDFKSKYGPTFVYPCSYVKMRFTGSCVKVRIINHHACYNNYIGVVADGLMHKVCVYNENKALEDVHERDGEYDVFTLWEALNEPINDVIARGGTDIATEPQKANKKNNMPFIATGGTDIATDSSITTNQACTLKNDVKAHETYTLVNDEANIHEIMLYKAMDCAHTYEFGGFILDDGAQVFECDALPALKLEFYGDSVTAGEVSEALDFCGKADPPHKGEYSNAYWSYAWLTARKMNARIHDIAQGGIALLDDTGWFDGPDFKGIFNVYDRIQYHMQLGETKRFDFNSYIPDAVIIAIGQNDANPEDYMASDYDGEKARYWRETYKYFVGLIRKRRLGAHIILTTTILNHSEAWDSAIEEVCNELKQKDSKVHHFLYTNNGCGTHGHIRKPEAERMADELSAYLRGLMSL